MQDFEREIVNNVKERIIREHEKTPFWETKVGIFLTTDWWTIFVDKLATMFYERKQETEYFETKDSQDIPTMHLSSVFPTKEIQEEVQAVLDRLAYEDLERSYKRMFSEYLDINEMEIESLTWEEIDELILICYKKRFPSSFKYLLLSNKAS